MNFAEINWGSSGLVVESRLWILIQVRDRFYQEFTKYVGLRHVKSDDCARIRLKSSLWCGIDSNDFARDKLGIQWPGGKVSALEPQPDSRPLQPRICQIRGPETR
ncbi:hypothetical protein AVEN_237811-1 [Araneus ventricosus]|uniref:Uncharacterized protein n=1 Tax=Araneus ventricosus TaxID=182803 RepID=A0A4Y2N4C7_ARAVE|nr:hypothetical protein AVEN_237811-1 [Araneus ventricosus]